MALTGFGRLTTGSPEITAKHLEQAQQLFGQKVPADAKEKIAQSGLTPTDRQALLEIVEKARSDLSARLAALPALAPAPSSNAAAQVVAAAAGGKTAAPVLTSFLSPAQKRELG